MLRLLMFLLRSMITTRPLVSRWLVVYSSGYRPSQQKLVPVCVLGRCFRWWPCFSTVLMLALCRTAVSFTVCGVTIIDLSLLFTHDVTWFESPRRCVLERETWTPHSVAVRRTLSQLWQNIASEGTCCCRSTFPELQLATCIR